MNFEAPDGTRAVCKAEWGCPAPLKVLVFAWRVATNSLATLENKNKWKLEVSNTCALCGLECEDTYHALCRCPLARRLWAEMARTWSMPKLETVVNTGPEWIIHLLDQCKHEERLPVVMTLWRSWYVRIVVYHHKPAPALAVSTRFLSGYINTLMYIQQNPSDDVAKGKGVISYGGRTSGKNQHKIPRNCSRLIARWSKPLFGWVKLNVDGAWMEEEGTGGAGMVLRDHAGSVIFSPCRFIP